MFKTTEQHEEFRAKVRAWAEEVVKPIKEIRHYGYTIC